MDRPTRDAGLLILDKPTGPTSHDVVDRIRRISGLRRVGHTGTLDPMASGVLVLCLGRATRLAEYFGGHDKRYKAVVRLGIETETYDAAGKVVNSLPVTVGREAIESALASFRGRIMQRPPAYSAIRIAGRRAHQCAREGRKVELEPRTVEFFRLELEQCAPPEFRLDVHCTSGTYIRSLAHDLGASLGCGAHLASLRRTACGPFRIDQATALESLETDPEWRRHLLPAETGLVNWPVLELTHEEARLLRTGRGVPFREGARPEPGDERLYRAQLTTNGLVAVVIPDHGQSVFRPHKVLG